MKHRDIEYLVVQGIGRNVWKWSVAFDADHRVAGQATRTIAWRPSDDEGGGLVGSRACHRPGACG
jgi:hypothetical protein